MAKVGKASLEIDTSEGKKKLSGRVALVTRAGRGIGRAIVLALAAEGANLAVNATRLSFAE